MSRGLGDTQRAALTELADAHERGEGVWLDELADTLGISDRRARAMAASLERHDVARREQRAWLEGVGERGPLNTGGHWVWSKTVGPDSPGARQDQYGRWVAPMGTPRRRTLIVLDPPSEYEAREARKTFTLRAMLGG